VTSFLGQTPLLQAMVEERIYDMLETPNKFGPSNQSRNRVTVDSMLRPLIPKFLINRKHEIEAMKAACKDQDLQAVARIAHGMKGASSSYGFSQMAMLASHIESAASDQKDTSLEEALETLKEHLSNLEVVYEL